MSNKLEKFINYFNIDQHFIIALILRLVLIIYSLIHDELFNLKYTDVDYSVFTDGSRYLLQGRSPFFRFGYRYSPIFAYLTLLNITFMKASGKLIFVLFDILTGYLIYKILRDYQINIREKPSKIATCLWLYNPLSLIVSTRGSSDSVITFLVLASILTLVRKKYFYSGLIFGFAVHCKLYPIIYSPAIYLFLSGHQARSLLEFNVLLPLSREKLKFFSSSILSFSIITYGFYLKFGIMYIEEAWIYHFERIDYAHNFSYCFYLYQLSSKVNYIKCLKYLIFLLQSIFILHFSIKYTLDTNFNQQYRIQNLLFSLFCITFFFVSLNKVCTSQYFLWYLSLLPLSVPYLTITYEKSFKMLILWFCGQGLWLIFAYLYEYIKLEVLFLVFLCSLIFLSINFYLIFNLINQFKIGFFQNKNK